MPNALLKKLGNYAHFSPGEVDCVLGLQDKRTTFGKSVDIFHEGQQERRAYILLDGWAFAYKLVPDGGRQVIAFLMPGDFLGMRSILLRVSDHSVATFTECSVVSISVERLAAAFDDYPRVGMAMLWSISRDEAVIVEHLVNIGRRSAIERTAHFFLEMGKRMQLAGLARENDFRFPFSQYLLADALGLTSIHVNRVLRELRERNLIELKDRQVVIIDPLGLIDLAGFDSDYLDQKLGPDTLAV